MSDERRWVVEWSQEAYDHWMSVPVDDDFTITITLNPGNYTIHRSPSNKPKLPPDYNPTRKHWESNRYIPRHRK